MDLQKHHRRTAKIGADCVACGCCVKVCPRGAIQIRAGHYRPGQPGPLHRLRQMCAGVSRQRHHMGGSRKIEKTLVRFISGSSPWRICVWDFFNILFAWLGLACFLIPLIIAIAGGTKGYCNRYCAGGSSFPCWAGALVFPAGGTSPPG